MKDYLFFQLPAGWRGANHPLAFYFNEKKNASAKERLSAIEGITVLQVTPEAEAIAERLLTKKIIPKKAFADAIHIAIAAEQGCDYLMTWNCRHIANAEIHFHVREFLFGIGLQSPLICTPSELMGEE